MIFFRPRVQRLLNFHYRIEIYTPAPKRQFGYYVWPFLLDGELVARVDLKRTDAELQVPGAFMEDGQDPARVAEALAVELRTMASWLGVGEVVVGAVVTSPSRYVAGSSASSGTPRPRIKLVAKMIPPITSHTMPPILASASALINT